MRLIGKITNKDKDGKVRFVSEIYEDADLRVFFTADADIDADGANGQNGKPAAYRVGDKGTDALKNADMKIVNGKVVCRSNVGRGIVILDTDNEPKVFPGGIIASHTWYQYPGTDAGDPAAYVDSETVPYIVVPPLVVQGTTGVVRGCRARATWKGKVIDCAVIDRGPTSKTGELSIAAARALGIPSNPRTGGLSEAEVLYELWPGHAAPGFVLQPA
ncbi:MAG: hypothetical protein V4574_21000 [Pseudomonadota bacterium]